MVRMRWSLLAALVLPVLAGCAEQRETAGTGASGAGASGQGGAPFDPTANPDGDCLTNEEELALGTDIDLADTDGDAIRIYRRLGLSDTERVLMMERRSEEWAAPKA